MSERRKLRAVVDSWDDCLMLTLTLAPGRYPDPRQIFEWLKAERYVARLIRLLVNRGLLKDGTYYCRMEFQMGTKKGSEGPPTEQVHFHVLLPVKFLPFDVVYELWNRVRAPFAAEHPDPNYPNMGHVRLDKPPANVRDRAAYVTAYVSKKGGIPEWFLDYVDDGHNATLSTHSQGMFERKKYKRSGNRRPCRPRKPIREAIASCRTRAVIVEEMSVFGGLKYRYVADAGDTDECLAKLGRAYTCKDLTMIELDEADHALLVGGVFSAEDELERFGPLPDSITSHQSDTKPEKAFSDGSKKQSGIRGSPGERSS